MPFITQAVGIEFFLLPPYCELFMLGMSELYITGNLTLANRVLPCEWPWVMRIHEGTICRLALLALHLFLMFLAGEFALTLYSCFCDPVDHTLN